MADELGALEKEYALALAPLEKKLPRIKALKEALQEACDAKPGDEWIVEGTKFGVKLGARAHEKKIDCAKLFKKLGAAAFTKFVAAVFAKYQSCGVSSLAGDVDGVVTTTQTGPRKLSTFEKGSV
jgi:hypothetical protein